MTTARLATGLVMRNTATASGRTRPAVAVETPRAVRACSTMAGRLASDDWGIMEAMSAEPRPGALGLSDPAACDLAGVKGAWLAYPYVGFLAANRMKPWRHCPRTIGVIARTDHLTTVRNAERVHAMVRNCGTDIETWIAEGTHSFDEPMSAPPMRHDPELTQEAIRRFTALLTDLAPSFQGKAL